MARNISKEEVVKVFNQACAKKRQLNFIPKVYQENLHFMEYKIRKQLKTFTILSLCGGDRDNFLVDAGFQRAFESMNFPEKVQYFNRSIDFATQSMTKQEENLLASKQRINQNTIKLNVVIAKGFKWEEVTIELKDFKVSSDSSFNIDLRNYLLRVSKKKDKKWYALEAKKKMAPETIRFSFISSQEHDKYIRIIQNRVEEAHKDTIFKMMSEVKEQRKASKQIVTNTNQIKLKVQGNQMKSDVNIDLKTPILKTSLSQSICEQIVKDKDSQDLEEELEEMVDQQNQIEEMKLEEPKQKSKIYKNLFKIIFPTYSLNDIGSLHHFKSVYQSLNSHLFIYHSTKIPQIYKMQMKLTLPLQVACQAIYNFELQKTWHPEISEGQTKMKITSENSCIGYQKHKALNEWYRQRDYVFLMHMFKQRQSYYIIGKSIENTNFIPFPSIIRGNIHQVIWKVTRVEEYCSISMMINISHEGLLNDHQKNDLTIRYLKGFENMQFFFSQKQNQKNLRKQLGFYWEVKELQSSQQIENHEEDYQSYQTCDFEENGSEIQEETIFYTINNLSDSEEQDEQHEDKVQLKEQPQIQPDQQVKTMKMSMVQETEEKMNLDKDGLVILPFHYLNKKQITSPFNSPPKPIELDYESKSIVLKDDWVLLPKGNLKLIHKKKIQAQDSVFKFILSTLKKNIFSGKGALNISLPVYIFNTDSTLQRTCQGLCLAPYLLEKAYQKKDKVERMKYCISFLLSNSILYFDVEKPFNPILGETYQGYIRGCPVYAEQISHHPPITSIYMIGRGYKIFGSLQAKVKIHMNSGEGINEGFYHVLFDDGQQVQFQTPPGQLNGLTVGDRGFSVKGRGVCLDKQNNLWSQIKLESSGGFFSGSKREFSDQIEGSLVQVKPEFMKKYLASPDKTPAKNDIENTFFELSGRWPLELRFDGEPFYRVNHDLPDRMIHEMNPLPSNSNYREDLYYRKQNDLARSQIEKERLQVIQRNDRKLREKFHGKKH